MPDPSVTVEGVDRLIAKLGRATAMQTLRAPVWRAGARLLKRLKTYPPEPTGSTYQRTGALGAAWAMQGNSGEGAGLSVSNSIAYGPFVQGGEQQTRQHHATGWATDAGAADAERQPFLHDLEQTIDAALRG